MLAVQDPGRWRQAPERLRGPWRAPLQDGLIAFGVPAEQAAAAHRPHPRHVRRPGAAPAHGRRPGPGRCRRGRLRRPARQSDVVPGNRTRLGDITAQRAESRESSAYSRDRYAWTAGSSLSATAVPAASAASADCPARARRSARVAQYGWKESASAGRCGQPRPPGRPCARSTPPARPARRGSARRRAAPYRGCAARPSRSARCAARSQCTAWIAASSWNRPGPSGRARAPGAASASPSAMSAASHVVGSCSSSGTYGPARPAARASSESASAPRAPTPPARPRSSSARVTARYAASPASDRAGSRQVDRVAPVDRLEHGGQPLRHGPRVGHHERDPRVPDAALGPHQPLRHRRPAARRRRSRSAPPRSRARPAA